MVPFADSAPVGALTVLKAVSRPQTVGAES